MRNLLFFAMSGVLLSLAFQAMAQIPGKWKNHDTRRPERPTVIPAIPSTQERAGKAPSDALVLIDGKDLSQWGDE